MFARTIIRNDKYSSGRGVKNAFVRWREMAREESLIWISIGWPLPLSLSRSGRRKGAAERRFSLIKFDYRRSLRVLVLLPETGYVTRRRAECDTTTREACNVKNISGACVQRSQCRKNRVVERKIPEAKLIRKRRKVWKFSKN